MALAFGVGLVVGIPAGCYLRERGYTQKAVQAYELFSPKTNAKKSDQFQNTNKQFYDNIKKGQVNHEDFERYIYGGTYNKKTTDDRDKVEDEMRQKLQNYQK